MSSDHPRGIDPSLLVAQIQNTAPYLFESRDEFDTHHQALMKSSAASTFLSCREKIKQPLTHFEYFKLCVSSHFLSCGTLVPTDVDNQIRQKLWPRTLAPAEALRMARWVLEVFKWDYSLLSDRVCQGAPGTLWEKQNLSGHHGEWFTLACGAYSALGQYAPEDELLSVRQALFLAIEEEVLRHSELFGSLWNSRDGIQCLRASTAIAHNLGDLDRVMDQWKLPGADPLRLRFYNLTSAPFESESKSLRYLGRLWVAGELYRHQFETPWGKGSLAFENHRHFALRKPKPLRRSRAFLIPIGPFFDHWGSQVGRALRESESELDEVIEALISGWLKLPRPTFAYLRGLAGILKECPHLKKQVETDLKKSARDRTKAFEQALPALGISEERFIEVLKKRALEALDVIPSTAKGG